MNLFQILEQFPDEKSTYNYFEQIRWNNKPKCCHCSSVKVSRRYDDFRYHCTDCRKRFSVLTNTYLHNTRMPLQKWLLAFAVVSDSKKGLSALQLQRNIGVTYVTAFKMSHKIRDIMAEEKIEMLEEVTEMDETFIGGRPRKPNVKIPLNKQEKGYLDDKAEFVKLAGFNLNAKKGNPAYEDVETKRGRGSQKQIPVVGVVQRDGAVIAEVMKKLTAKNLESLVERTVNSENSIIISDKYKGYNKLHKIIEHIKIDHNKIYSYRGINTNTIESFWAIVERGIMGTYHQVSLKYLPKYIVEFCFKYNNRQYDDMFETLCKASMHRNIPPAIIKNPDVINIPKKTPKGHIGRKKPNSLKNLFN